MSDIDDAIAAGAVILRDAILFDLLEGTYGFWWGEGEFNWNGQVFHGAGSLLSVGEVGTGGDGEPTELEVRLRAMPDAGLTPDVLGTIEQYGYHRRPAILYRFVFSPVDGTMIGAVPEVRYRGIINQIEHEDAADGQYALVARIVSRSTLYRSTGYQRCNTETQRAFNGGAPDLFFAHAAAAAAENAKWGRG